MEQTSMPILPWLSHYSECLCLVLTGRNIDTHKQTRGCIAALCMWAASDSTDTQYLVRLTSIITRVLFSLLLNKPCEVAGSAEVSLTLVALETLLRKRKNSKTVKNWKEQTFISSSVNSFLTSGMIARPREWCLLRPREWCLQERRRFKYIW